MECMYPVFTRMPGESYCRRLRTLLIINLPCVFILNEKKKRKKKEEERKQTRDILDVMTTAGICRSRVHDAANRSFYVGKRAEPTLEATTTKTCCMPLAQNDIMKSAYVRDS